MERLFSTGSKLFTPRRNRLGDANFGQKLFLNTNKKIRTWWIGLVESFVVTLALVKASDSYTEISYQGKSASQNEDVLKAVYLC